MSLVLIVLALLCVRSQMSLGNVDLGFDIDHGVVADSVSMRVSIRGRSGSALPIGSRRV